MKFIVILLVLFTSLSLFAKKDVSVSEKVQSFFYDINSSTDSYHRSGASLENEESIPVQAKKSWNNGIKHNYKVIESMVVVEKIRDRLFSEKKCSKKDLIVKSFDKKSTLLIEKKSSPKPANIIPAGNFSKEDYVEIAKSYISGLKDLDDSIEVDNVAFETSKCSDCEESFYRQEQISGIYIRLRRVFEGGLVRGDTSKILIKLDPDGSLRKLKIKWPEFQKIEKDEAPATFDENIFHLIDDLSNNDTAHVVSDKAALEIISYEIDGAAKAWISFVKDGETILTPAVSYKLNVLLGDETVVSKIVDCPLMPSYLKFNKKNIE